MEQKPGVGSPGGAKLMEIGGQIGLKGESNKAERLRKHLQRKGWRRFEKRESSDDRGGFEAAREGGGKWGMTERKVGSRGEATWERFRRRR